MSFTAGIGCQEQMRFQFSFEGLSVCSSFNVYWQPIPDAGAATEKARSPSFSLVRRVCTYCAVVNVFKMDDSNFELCFE